MKTMVAFIRDETAATSIEYALIAASIALSIIVAVNSLGTSMSNRYSNVKTALD